MRDISDHRCYKKTDSLVQQRRFNVAPVSEEMCQERAGTIQKAIDSLTEEMMKWRILLFTGNGKPSMSEKVNTVYKAHTRREKSTQGWIDWAFRLLIICMLGWLGLK